MCCIALQGGSTLLQGSSKAYTQDLLVMRLRVPAGGEHGKQEDRLHERGLFRSEWPRVHLLRCPRYPEDSNVLLTFASWRNLANVRKYSEGF